MREIQVVDIASQPAYKSLKLFADQNIKLSDSMMKGSSFSIILLYMSLHLGKLSLRLSILPSTVKILKG